jgi:hypothetical protein
MLDVKGYVRNSFKEKPLQHRSQPVLENSQTAQHDQGDTGKVRIPSEAAGFLGSVTKGLAGACPEGDHQPCHC